MRSKKAFTLIELLVVIAIIALLLAILIPSLSIAKERARRVIDMTNLRQTGLGLNVYAEQNDGKLPPQYGNIAWRAAQAYVDGGSSSKPKAVHLGLVYENRMIDNPEIFYCPSQPRKIEYPWPYDYYFYTRGNTIEWGSELIEPPSMSGHKYVRTSYNYWIHGEMKLAKLASTKPIVVDNCQEWEVLPHKKSSSGDPQGLSALFVDGHTSFCIRKEIFDDALWPKDFSTYFNGPGNDLDLFTGILRQVEISQ